MRKAVYFRSWRRTVLARPSHEGDVLYRVWHGRSLAQTVTEFPKARQAIRIVQTLAIWQRCWRRGSYDVQVSLGSFVFFAQRFVFFYSYSAVGNTFLFTFVMNSPFLSLSLQSAPVYSSDVFRSRRLVHFAPRLIAAYPARNNHSVGKLDKELVAKPHLYA